MIAAPLPTLNADEPFITRLIDLFCDPARSLFQIAEELGLTFQALTLLLTRPAIRARLNAIDSAAAFHTRFVAGLHLPALVPSLASTLKANIEAEKSIPIDFTNPISIESARRRQDCARRAGALLLRLARFSPGPTLPRAPRAHDPSGTPLPSSLPLPVQNATALQTGDASRPSSTPAPTTHPTTPTPPKSAAAPQPSFQPPSRPLVPPGSSPNPRIQQLQNALLRSNLPQPVS